MGQCGSTGSTPTAAATTARKIERVQSPVPRRGPSTHALTRFPARLYLAAEILVAYVRARRLMRRSDLPSTLAVLRKHGDGLNGQCAGEEVAEALRLANATVRLLSVIPADSRCLMCSLVLSRLLDRRRIPCALVIGVRPGAAFGAHAWVEVGAYPVLARGDGTFARLIEL